MLLLYLLPVFQKGCHQVGVGSQDVNKAVKDSIRDTEVAIRRLKNDVQAWRASVATSRPQQGQPELAGRIEDLVTNTELEISKVCSCNNEGSGSLFS